MVIKSRANLKTLKHLEHSYRNLEIFLLMMHSEVLIELTPVWLELIKSSELQVVSWKDKFLSWDQFFITKTRKSWLFLEDQR